MIKFQCFACRKELSFTDAQIGRREECPACRADVRVCKNCEFYDAKAYNECREPSADVMREKDRANFCDFFTPRKGNLGELSSAEKMKAAAEALFKKS